MIYFYNPETKDSIWTVPKGYSEEQVMSFSGAEKYRDQLKKVFDGEKGQVRASHLLVKHKDSRRPSSWKEVCSGPPLIAPCRAMTDTLLTPLVDRQILRVRKKKQSRFLEDIRKKSMRHLRKARSSPSSRRNIRIVHLTAMVAISDGLGPGKCRRHLKRRRTR